MIHSILNNKSIYLAATLLMTITLNSSADQINISNLPDPTRYFSSSPLTSNNSPNKKIKLQSILYSAQRRSVVINGHVKYVGSTINGSRIIDIQQNTVIINRNGRLQTLHLYTSKSVTRREEQL